MSGDRTVGVRKLDIGKKLPTRSKVYQLKWTNCNKDNCDTCPHGPYWYEWMRVEGRQKMRYIGKYRPRDVTLEEEVAMLANMRLPDRKKRRRKKASGE